MNDDHVLDTCTTCHGTIHLPPGAPTWAHLHGAGHDHEPTPTGAPTRA